MSIGALSVLLVLWQWNTLLAGESNQPFVRELYVPAQHLPSILQAGGQRVFLKRSEYELLVQRARAKSPVPAPHPVVLLDAQYDARIEHGLVTVHGTLVFDVVDPGLHAVSLPLKHLGIWQATLDGQPAPLAKESAAAQAESTSPDLGQEPVGVTLFLEGQGRHELTLEMIGTLVVEPLQQTWRYELPVARAGFLRVALPGFVELKSGPTLIDMSVDEQQETTTLQLALVPGVNELILSRNHRLTQSQQAMSARSVYVSEITLAYERLYASIAIEVMHGEVETFEFSVPQGFEILNVETPLLSRWTVEATDAGNVLNVQLVRPVADTVVFHVSAEQIGGYEGRWTMPIIAPQHMRHAVSLRGILLEPRLGLESLSAPEALPIEVDTLLEALPPGVLKTDQRGPQLRPVAALYVPHAADPVGAQLTVREDQLAVTSRLLVSVSHAGLQADGGFVLTPSGSPIREFQLQLEPGWRVTQLIGLEGQSIPYDIYEEGDETRLRVVLPQAVKPGSTFPITFQATGVPDGWFDQWSSMGIRVPSIRVVEATSDAGAVAIRGTGDIDVVAGNVSNVSPLDAAGKAEHQLQAVETPLAYAFDDRSWTIEFQSVRRESRQTAEIYSFFNFSAEKYTAHYELVFDIENARTEVIRFQLPQSTPVEVQIEGLDGTGVKDYRSAIVDGWREWTVTLSQPVEGRVVLAVTCEQANPAETDRRELQLELPIARATNVAYQNGIVAVEVSEDLLANIQTTARRLDIGELIDAHYKPGRRLLGSFGYVGQSPPFVMTLVRPLTYSLPGTLVQRAEMVTAVSAHGVMQTAARFQLHTKSTYIAVELPRGSELWSVHVDGSPAKPQRDGEQLLISFPARNDGSLRELHVVWESPVGNLSFWKDVQLRGVRLWARLPDHAELVEVPIVDIQWHVAIPQGYRLVGHDGTVSPTKPLGMAGADGVWQRPVTQWARHVLSFPNLHATAPRGRAASERATSAGTVQLAEESAGPVDDTTRFRGGSEKKSDTHDRPPNQTDMKEFEDQDSPNGETPASNALGELQNASRPKASPWALQGLRSLPIELTTIERRTTFTSLGGDPLLELDVVHVPHWHLVAWTAAAITVGAGLIFSLRTGRVGWKYIVGVLVVATVVPVVMGWNALLALPWDFAAYGALVLAGWSVMRSVAARLARGSARQAVVTALVLCVGGIIDVGAARAQETPQSATTAAARLDIQPPVVTVPQDAVVIPFDPDQGWEKSADDTVIVSLEAYERLWNAIRAARNESRPKVPASHAVTEVRWHALLGDADSLAFRGEMSVEVYQQQPVWVAFPVQGGAIAHVLVNGAPARIRMEQATRDANSEQRPTSDTQPAGDMAWIQLPGEGQHTLTWSIQFPVRRDAGWREVQGVLPAAAIAPVELKVPEPHTDLRLAGVSSHHNYISTSVDETVKTVLLPTGAFSFRWRPQTRAGHVDRGLIVQSQSLFDIQEDGYRSMWQLDYRFPQDERDELELRLPDGYMLDRVSGDNVRGWTQNGQDVRVMLLQPAQNQQSVTVIASSRAETRLYAEDSTILVPAIETPGAMLHQGRIVIRRSPYLELRVAEAQGVTRTDLVELAISGSDQGDSPFGMQPFQAYDFHDTTYALTLAGKWVDLDYRATVQTLLRISETRTWLESRVLVTPTGRPVYRLSIRIPDDLQISSIDAPGLHEWSLVEVDGTRRVDVYLTQGQAAPFAVVLRGELSPMDASVGMPAPVIVVEDASEHHTEIVVQTDPGWSVRWEALENAEAAANIATFRWLKPDQHQFARAALRSDVPQFLGTLQLDRRTPRITCQAVTNVRVTNRAFEETILLDYQIAFAGVRELSFLLPVAMRDAHVEAPLVRSKAVEDTEDGQSVRVRLELQDAVIGRYRVLIGNDRPLSYEPFQVPIPSTVTGQLTLQFVTLENACRDEMVIVSRDRFVEVDRQQRHWQTLTQMLGGPPKHAYVAEPGDGALGIAIGVTQRKLVETAEARILLARTLLVLDENGAYRAQQIYHLDNRTEPFLEIVLPAGASLWTAQVAGAPVKPLAVNTTGNVDPSQKRFRIPLVKTAAGDRDYLVELKYGGQGPPLSTWADVDFPFLQTVNVSVEESQVRVLLPTSYRWVNFRGSMRRAESDTEVHAGVLRYKLRQLSSLQKSLESNDEFTKARALANARELTREIEQLEQTQVFRSAPQELQEKLANAADQQRFDPYFLRGDVGSAAQEPGPTDNRLQLNRWYQSQSAQIARDQLRAKRKNFEASDATAKVLGGGATSSADFGAKDTQLDWVQDNALQSGEASAPADAAQAGEDRIQLGVQADPAPDVQSALESVTEKFAASFVDKERGPYSDADVSQQQDRVRRFGEMLNDEHPAENGPSASATPQKAGAASRNEASAPLRIPADELQGNTGWASLDILLPERGEVFQFTTPRGDIRLRATAMEQQSLLRAQRGAIVLAIVLIAGAWTRIRRRAR